MAGTAERIGSAVGTAQREVRRRLELVRSQADESLAAAEKRADKLAREDADLGSKMVQEIEEGVSRIRDAAAHNTANWLDMVEERVARLRVQASAALVDVRKAADQFPLQTIAAIAGVCFAAGFALRFRRPRRG
jgi:hypothetical protein